MAKWRQCQITTRRCGQSPLAQAGQAVAFSLAMPSDVSILAALLAGLISFLSPCVLPLVPPYLAYLAGTSIERFADAESKRRVGRETIFAAPLFVCGFSTVFVAPGLG